MDAIICIDESETVFLFNTAAERIFGFQRDSVMGNNLGMLIPERYRAEHTGHIKRFALTNTTNRKMGELGKIYGLAADGREIPFEASISQISTESGRLFTVILRDISERKRLQTELRRFVELSPTVLYALRIEPQGFKSTWLSQNLFALTGHKVDDDRAYAWWVENIHQEDQPRVLNAHPLPYEIEHQALEYRFRKKNGSYIWLRDEKRLVRDENGKPSEIIGSWSDVTEKLLLEAQMRHAQKMEAIGQLAAGVAHDFNNLLTVIGGNAALIVKEKAALTDIQEWAGEIRDAADKASFLTKQLLQVGRRQALSLKSIDLNSCIQDTLGILRRILGEDIDIRTQTPASDLHIFADAGMLTQVLLNLAVNARDSMPNGGILAIESARKEFDEISARGIPQARAGAYAQLSVSDTGTGIPKDVLPRIFDPFFTTKDAGKGTGLGLATVFGIVQQHQGWINVYSEHGHGTTFRVYLPLTQGSVPQPEAGEAKDDSVSRGKETILVVEDQLALRKMAKTILTRLGYQVLEAGTGNEALTVWDAHQHQIHVIMTDIIMPDGMNGFDLAKKLREKKADLKIIFTSGYSPDLVKTGNSLTEGINFLAKPYSIADLSRILRANLDDKKG